VAWFKSELFGGRMFGSMNCTFRNHSLDGVTLFSKLDSNKLRFNVKNEMALIYANFDADLINKP